MRRTVAIAAVLIALVAASAACNPVAPAPSGDKPLLTGLIDKGSEGPYHLGQPYPVVDLSGVSADAGSFGGVVVNQTWAQLEPARGTFDFSTLDASLAAVQTYDTAHPSTPLGVRLRVFAAYAAPSWAKSLDGTTITVAAHLPDNTGGTLGQWWKPGYRGAWAALQKALAARYDTNPVLHEVAVTSCSTLTAEPFVLAPGTITLATADGWTPAAQQSCLDGAFSDYAPWTHTAIYYPMNPLAGSDAITTEVMHRCVGSAKSGGPRCVLANNALGSTSTASGPLAQIYAEMDKRWGATGTPIAFQMNGPDTSTWCTAIAVAVAHHARSVELWPAAPGRPGYTGIPLATLHSWDRDLHFGTSPTC